MQADLYIRGGTFDQTLLLIDGIKVEDPQTGHHTMNMTLPLEVIEKIEITKGSVQLQCKLLKEIGLGKLGLISQLVMV